MFGSTFTSSLAANSHLSRAACSQKVQSLERTQPQRQLVIALLHMVDLRGLALGGLTLSIYLSRLGCGGSVVVGEK